MSRYADDRDTLKAVAQLPPRFQGIFKFRYFNALQSEVFSDVFESDANMVVAAPTGSGKTVLFELAILRLASRFLLADGSLLAPAGRSKVIYIAPMKALVQEKLRAWESTFGRLGLVCEELTGDSGSDDASRLHRSDIILTTPEKFDSLSRRSRNLNGLGWIGDVSLVIIDEVHLLNDPRGAVLEAVVSRMKMVSTYPEMREYPIAKLRLVAVSATIPNIGDIAEWLGATGSGCRKFGEEMRPVKLSSTVIEGSLLGPSAAHQLCSFSMYPHNLFTVPVSPPMGFWVNAEAPAVPSSQGKPCLVFCSTRKGARDAANFLAQQANHRLVKGSEHSERLQVAAMSTADKQLQACIRAGVGFHNGGLDHSDRSIVEGLFLRGDMQVLCTTGTLAVGVNLPAHLVVIKSTQYYNKERGGYIEYERSAVLQMAGRAGRPQFDNSGCVVIMTRQDTVHMYRNLMVGSEPIESGLLNCIVEHLNAEIVLLTVTDVSLAIDWLKSSFLYVRLRKNPKFYGLPADLSDDQLKMRLRTTRELTDFGMITSDADGFTLRPDEPGKLMAHFYMSFETMKAITAVPDQATEEDLLWVISKSSELSWIKLRRSEKRVLNEANKDKAGRMRYQFGEKGKRGRRGVQQDCEKIFVLVNDALSGEPVITEFSLTQDVASICTNGARVANCMARYFLWGKRHTEAVAALKLAKCLAQRLWDDSPLLLRQLPGVGNVTAKALLASGIDTFEKLQRADPRKLEAGTGRKYPFGNQVKEGLESIPPPVDIDIAVDGSVEGRCIQVTLARHNASAGASKACWSHMVVAEVKTNKVLYTERIRRDSFKSPYTINLPPLSSKPGNSSVAASLVDEGFVGRDITVIQPLSATKPASHIAASAKSAVDPHHENSTRFEKPLPDFEPPNFELQHEAANPGKAPAATNRDKEGDAKRKHATDSSLFAFVAKKAHKYPSLRSSFLPHGCSTANLTSTAPEEATMTSLEDYPGQDALHASTWMREVIDEPYVLESPPEESSNPPVSTWPETQAKWGPGDDRSRSEVLPWHCRPSAWENCSGTTSVVTEASQRRSSKPGGSTRGRIKGDQEGCKFALEGTHKGEKERAKASAQKVGVRSIFDEIFNCPEGLLAPEPGNPTNQQEVAASTKEQTANRQQPSILLPGSQGHQVESLFSFL